VWAALGVVLVASVLTGCRPNPVLQPVTPPGGDWTALVSMNASGVAVGVTSRADGAHAIAYDTHRGSFVELPDPGPSAELPSGGTFIRANDIDDNGVVLGSVAPRPDGHDTALYDTVAGTWQFFDCSSFFVLGRGSLSNSGLVACGDHVYDSNTKTAIAVPMPPDCDGQVFKVNASSIAVGSCHGGPEPLFATDLTTGTTVGFGTAAGIVTDADDPALTPTFTDSGWLVAGQTVNGIGRTFVFRVPSHLGSTVPSLVDLGPFSDGPTRAPAIDDHGLLAGNFRIGGTWMFGTYDVVTGEIERLDDRALPEAVDPGDTLITGIDDTGAVVGIQMNIPDGPIYQSFATAPD
jgi:hypothetical protein